MLSGATVTHSGNLTDLGSSWRNPDVSKPLDLDNNQVLGSDGYHLVNLPPVRPSYVAESTILSSTFAGNGGYSLIDDPGQPGGSFLTGAVNPRPGTGSSANLFSFTLNTSAEGRMIRVGLLVDNLDGVHWNASGISLVQSDNPQSSSGLIPTVVPVLNNRVPDWVFFDITGGKAGDTFVVRAIGGASGTATMGGVAFDSIHPDGGPVRTSSQGIANVYPSRALLGEPPQGLYRMTLTLSNLTCPAQGMSVLLVGPGGQKIRPMSHAFGTFDTAGGQTILTFDDYASGPLPVLAEGAIAPGTYKPDTDQSPPSLPAPAPSGPYSSPLSAAQSGQVAGVWSLYVNGTSVRMDSWSLKMIPIHAPLLANASTMRETVQVAPYSDSHRGGMTAAVNPGGLPTTVWMEWGPTLDLGRISPPKEVGSGNQPIQYTGFMSPPVGGLLHLRIGASNQLGVIYTPTQAVILPSFFRTFPGGPFPSGPVPIPGTPMECGDFNTDGKLDFLLTQEFSKDGYFLRPPPSVWINTGSGFARQLTPGLPTIDGGQISPGDVDNDGRLDFLLTGFTNTTTTSQLWFNTGAENPNFERFDLRGIASVGIGTVTWGDYDNDGRLDFLLTGNQGTRRVGQLWRNSGAAFVNVTSSVLPGFPEIRDGSVAWGDYDGDGWLDILVSDTSTTQIWRNNGIGFTRVPDAAAPGLPGLRDSAVAWGDYDNDGRLDFLISGETSLNQPTTQIWRNTGSGFSNVSAEVADGIPGVVRGSVAWGDHDNDGRLDILLVGQGPGSIDLLQLWQNTGTAFINITSSAFPTSPLACKSGAWADMDNDGRLDLLLGVEAPTGLGLVEISRNQTWSTNTPPTAPKGLRVSAGPNGVTFSWQPATDAQTPSAGLSYHLRVGTTPGGSDLVSPMARPDGKALLTRHGALRPGLSRTITGLPNGRTLYWSIQAQDTAYAGSEFTSGQFVIGQALATSSGQLIPGDTDGDGLVDDRELTLVLAKLAGGLRTVNAAGLYSPSQIQALNVGTPMLAQVAPGQFRLTLGLEKATRLTNFVAFPFLAPQTRINESGELEFLFSSPDDAAFFRVEAR